jgi:hypothetical protein
MRLVPAVCLGLFGAVMASASLIQPAITVAGPTFTSFTANPSAGTPFTESFVGTNSGTSAAITSGSIACTVSTGCSGNAADFSGSISGISGNSFLNIAIDGNLSGTTPVTGVVSVSGTVPILTTASVNKTYAFSITPGDFNVVIGSNALSGAFGSNFNFSGTVSFNMAQAQTITLPSSLSFTLSPTAPTTAPEPGTWAMLAIAIATLAIVRFKNKQTA